MTSLPSYALAGFRKTHRFGAEASLKYVLFGAASTAIMAYGLSLIYGLCGTLQVNVAAQHLLHSPSGGGALLAVGLFGLIVGLSFKVAAVPFHFWCPDVFEGAGMEVTNFLSVASKGAGLVMLLRQLLILADAAGYRSTPHLSLGALAAVIGVIGALTATVGNVAAFVQENVKRLLAYSSIAQAGYILCALSLLVNHGGNRVTRDGVNVAAQTVLIYLAVYLFMNLGAFTVAGLVWRQTGSEELSAYAGLGRRSPLLAAAMFCCLVSLIGLPPFAGFAAKLYLLIVLMQNGGWWWWLVGAVAVNTVLSAFYYFRVVQVMYLRDDERAAEFVGNPIGMAVAVCSAAMLVVMLIGYNPLANLTARFSHLAGVEGSPRVASANH
jgi:NADH-quinone oxidoreductase subunit N